jgi:glycosyltransferase involved in cell wall biosynthesis
MKICIVTQTFPRFREDATAPFMFGLCQGLYKAGNSVYVFAPYDRMYKKRYLPSYVKLYTYKYIWPPSLHLMGYSRSLVNDKKLRFRVFMLAPFYFFFGFLNLFFFVKRERIDVLSAHWLLPNGFLAVLVKKFTGVKVVSTLPGSDVYLAKKNNLYKAFAVFSANNSDGITSNSLQLKKDLVSLGARIRKFKQIIYSVDTSVFKPSIKGVAKLRKKLGIEKNDIIVLGVGRLVEKKGFSYLITAAAKLIAKNRNVKVILVGDGDQRRQLEEQSVHLDIAKHVIFVGMVSYDLLSVYYNLADVFILPSVRDSEGNLDDQSVSVIEAMSCGKPVVTTDFLGYRYVIQDGENGYLIPEKNVERMVNALARLIASKALRIRIGRNARKTILTRFTWLQIGKEYTEFFKKL